MPDYRDMYFTLSKAAGQAIEILIEAQRACEALYIASAPELKVIPGLAENKKGVDQE